MDRWLFDVFYPIRFGQPILGGPETKSAGAAAAASRSFRRSRRPEALEAFRGGPSKWLPSEARGRPEGAILFERPDRSRRGRRATRNGEDLSLSVSIPNCMPSKERKLHSIVERYVERHFNCCVTGREVGSRYVGLADVLGVRDTGGMFHGGIEVIAVEVKRNANNFGKLLGQALGYSLFAHRCYLATRTGRGGFSPEQKEMATKLGVGLIQIKGKKCEEILTSPPHQPIPNLMLTALNNMDVGVCQLCDTPQFHKNWTKRMDEAVAEYKGYYSRRQIKDRKVLFTERKIPYRDRVICRDCIKTLRLVDKPGK